MDNPICITAPEVAALLRCDSPRRLERRHTWEPAFPQPISKRPLVWYRTDVEGWIHARARFANNRAA